jgi:hypothetical protein
MISTESIIIALLASIIGIVIGTSLGLALTSSLRTEGVTTISVPITNLVAFVGLSALLGAAAAIWQHNEPPTLTFLSRWGANDAGDILRRALREPAADIVVIADHPRLECR